MNWHEAYVCPAVVFLAPAIPVQILMAVFRKEHHGQMIKDTDTLNVKNPF